MRTTWYMLTLPTNLTKMMAFSVLEAVRHPVQFVRNNLLGFLSTEPSPPDDRPNEFLIRQSELFFRVWLNSLNLSSFLPPSEDTQRTTPTTSEDLSHSSQSHPTNTPEVPLRAFHSTSSDPPPFQSPRSSDSFHSSESQPSSSEPSLQQATNPSDSEESVGVCESAAAGESGSVCEADVAAESEGENESNTYEAAAAAGDAYVSADASETEAAAAVGENASTAAEESAKESTADTAVGERDHGADSKNSSDEGISAEGEENDSIDGVTGVLKKSSLAPLAIMESLLLASEANNVHWPRVRRVVEEWKAGLGLPSSSKGECVVCVCDRERVCFSVCACSIAALDCCLTVLRRHTSQTAHNYVTACRAWLRASKHRQAAAQAVPARF